MAAKNITQQQFYELIGSDKPTLVDFWAPWCGYCRRIAPVYEQIADSYADTIEIVKLNIDEAMAVAQEEQVDVIPTLILYRAGKALDRVVAPQSKAAIDQFIADALKK